MLIFFNFLGEFLTLMANIIMKGGKMLNRGEVIPGSYDPIFKSLMNTYREYLADIVSFVTKIDKKYFLDNFVFKNVEYIKDNYHEKRMTSDLVVEIKNSMINIEMNNFKYKELSKRNSRYLYKMVNSNWEKDRFIQINIDNFKTSDEVISKFVMMNEKTLEKDEFIERYRISLVKIEEKYYNEEKLTREEKELLMLRLKNKETLEKISKGDKLMEEVNKKIEEMSEDPNLQLVYNRDEYVRYEAEQLAKDKYEDRMNDLEKKNEFLNEKDKTLNEKDKSLNEKDKSLNEKDKTLNEKAKQLVEKEKHLENRFNNLINNLQKSGLSINEISNLLNLTKDEIDLIIKNSK